MTRSEWKNKLKKGISALPGEEQDKVLDYYDELFDDKLDAHMTEEQITEEFGNPFEVASKILSDYYAENKSSHSENTNGENPYTSGSGAGISARRNGHRNKNPYEDDTEYVDADGHTYKKNEHRRFGGRFKYYSFPLALFLFFLLGAFWGKWHPGWMLFLVAPVITSFIDAINKRNPRHFAYPLLVVVLYLGLGFDFGLWHPMWILFLTIPLYYAIVPSRRYFEDRAARREEKRRTRRIICIILSAVLIVCCILFSGIFHIGGCGMPLKDFNKSDFDYAKCTDKTQYEESISNIEIETSLCAVIIDFADVDKTTLYVGDDVSKDIKYSLEKGKLSIVQTKKNYSLFIGNESAAKYNDGKMFVYITLAQNTKTNLECDCATGYIDITGNFEDLEVNSETAKVVLHDINVSTDIECMATTGSIKLNNITCANEVKAYATTGELRADKIACKSFVAQLTTGGIALDDIETDNAKLKTTTGNINFKLSTASKIEVEVTTGNVSGKILGTKAEYSIAVNGGVGKCNLANQTGTTQKTLKIKYSTGSVDIEFNA